MKYILDEKGFVIAYGNIEGANEYPECPNICTFFWKDIKWQEDTSIELLDCQQQAKNQVQEKWQSIVDDGYTNNGNKYNYDDETLAIIAARLAHCNSTTNLGDAELVFYNSDKEPITFADKASIVQFFEDFITSRNHIDQNKLSLKAQVEACATKEEVEAIDITVGW